MCRVIAVSNQKGGVNVNIFIVFTTCNCNIHNTKSFFF